MGRKREGRKRMEQREKKEKSSIMLRFELWHHQQW